MSATSRGYLVDFNGGQTLTKVQALPLGYVGQDPKGNRWSYVRFDDGPYSAGEWVRDSLPDTANATANVDVGKNILTVGADKFLTSEESVGAIGLVNSGDGVGQGFVVTEWLEKGKVRIRLLHDSTDRLPSGDGFTTRLSASTGGGRTVSNVHWSLPGRVSLGAATGTPRGVVQRDITNTQLSDEGEGRFGWVQQSGVGVVMPANAAIAAGAVIRGVASGAADDGTAGTPIGYALFASASGNQRLITASLNIENYAVAMGGPAAKRAVGSGAPPIS